MKDIQGHWTCTIVVLQNIGGMLCWRRKIEWNLNETSPSHLKKETGKFEFFRSFASRRSRQGQIFHCILIGFISPVAEASLGHSDLSWIFDDATIADCGTTEFNDFWIYGLCGIVLDVDKPLDARW